MNTLIRAEVDKANKKIMELERDKKDYSVTTLIIPLELSMIGFLAIEMSILKYSDNSLIKMNTIQALKKCIQIDFSEYT